MRSLLLVMGYKKKSNVTGAISSVKSEDLEDLQLPRIETALQGRTSGVSVVQSSGQPGSGSVIRIRGTSSINGSDPLYVVDGVIIGGGIDFLNPGDIETIEVLKDAASAAIYGARGANECNYRYYEKRFKGTWNGGKGIFIHGCSKPMEENSSIECYGIRYADERDVSSSWSAKNLRQPSSVR